MTRTAGYNRRSRRISIADELWLRYLDHIALPADDRERINAERLLPVEETYGLLIKARINGLNSLD